MNPNNLTDEQVAQGYSTIEGGFDPLTGKPKATTPTGMTSIAQPTPNNLTPEQVSQGYSTIPGTFDPVTGKPKSGGGETSKLAALGVTPEELTKLNSPEGLDPNSFTSLLDKVKTRLTLNNGLMDQRALIMKHLFDSPLEDDELEKLPEDVQNVLEQGKDAAELQLRIINDQLQGRAQSLSSSISDLTAGYQATLDAAEQKKEAAEANIINYLNMYGSGAIPFLKAKYPEASDVIDRLAGVATLEEIRAYDTGSGSGSGTSNQMTDNERALFTQFKGEPIVKEYNTILSKKMTVDKILDSKLGGPGDLAIVYEFMKGLDPTSVVRETEYESAAKSGNIFAGAMARFNGYLKPEGGFLPDNVKQAFKSIVDSKLKVQRQLYDNVAQEYRGIAERQGLNPDNAVVGYSKADTSVDQGTADLSGWLTDYNYDKDIADAKAAIKAGADKAAVKARLLQKYKQVDL